MFEKCNTKTEKEIWDIVKDTDFKNPSTIKILDIGCGVGNVFFHFYVNPDFNTSDFIGIEMNCLHQIKRDRAAFNIYDDDDLREWLDKQRTYDPYLYFQKLIELELLKPDPKINEHKFNSLFMDKILWGTKIEKSKFLEKTNDKFDLLILSDVIHYKAIKNPRCVINKCINLLTKDGLIFVKSPINNNLNKRRMVDKIIFEEWTMDLNKFKEIKNDKGFLYFLGKK